MSKDQVGDSKWNRRSFVPIQFSIRQRGDPYVFSSANLAKDWRKHHGSLNLPHLKPIACGVLIDLTSWVVSSIVTSFVSSVLIFYFVAGYLLEIYLEIILVAFNDRMISAVYLHYYSFIIDLFRWRFWRWEMEKLKAKFHVKTLFSFIFRHSKWRLMTREQTRPHGNMNELK